MVLSCSLAYRPTRDCDYCTELHATTLLLLQAHMTSEELFG